MVPKQIKMFRFIEIIQLQLIDLDTMLYREVRIGPAIRSLLGNWRLALRVTLPNNLLPLTSLATVTLHGIAAFQQTKTIKLTKST